MRYTVSQVKKRRANPSGAPVQAVKVIHLKQPDDGRFQYRHQEAATYVYQISQDTKMSRAEKSNITQTNIDQKWVPVQSPAFNDLIKNHGAPGQPPAKQYWKEGGEDIMDIEGLYRECKQHTERLGAGWSSDNTRNSLITALEKKHREKRFGKLAGEASCKVNSACLSLYAHV